MVNGSMAVLLGLPVVGFLLGPILEKRTERWVELGAVADFVKGAPKKRRVRYTTADGYREQTKAQNVWVHWNEERLTVFSAECPHVGCNVIWNSDSNNYVCPCHGGRFDVEGTVLDGPPPRPLDQIANKIEGEKIYIQV